MYNRNRFQLREIGYKVKGSIFSVIMRVEPILSTDRSTSSVSRQKHGQNFQLNQALHSGAIMTVKYAITYIILNYVKIWIQIS